MSEATDASGLQPRARPVLVADDDEELRSMVREYLEGQGYEVLEAANGVEALWTIKHRRCGVVVLDLVMPRLGGLAAIPQILKFDPSIRIIVVSGQATAQAVAELQQQNVPVLTKPVDLVALRALVAQALVGPPSSKTANA